MPHQVATTVCAPVLADRVGHLRDVLAEMGADPAGNDVLPFGALTGVHFARLVLVDDGTPVLVLTLDLDAPERFRLRQLVSLAGPGLDRLLGNCADYPAAGRRSDRERLRYLRGHRAASAVFYLHAMGRTVEQVRDEARLRSRVEDFLDRSYVGLRDRSPTEVRDAVRSYVRGERSLSWAMSAPPRPALHFRLREMAHLVTVPLLLLVLLPAVLPLLLVWLLALRLHERTDAAPEVAPDPGRLRALGDAEDFGPQNAFTSLAAIKPGRFWAVTSAMSVLFADYAARHVFTRGSLGGLTTVHFARFLRLGPGNRMLFTSYYDGSLESYNNDFVDQVAWVLNTVFGQQDGYPRTRWLVLDGAHDEIAFKAFIRGHQVATQVWWSAYPELPAVTVDANARLRAGLSAALTSGQTDAWLRLL
jgi:hypothetical protein